VSDSDDRNKGLATREIQLDDGSVELVPERRLLPRIDPEASEPVPAKERVDVVAWRALGSPHQAFRIYDANDLRLPSEWLSVPGRPYRVPLRRP